jgi:uncharacterized protein YfaS (alpha-2-macroglobulin family)
MADFFDENLMQQRLSSAIEKMGKLQNSDGSWSWWPGMRGSTYMTVSISEMLVRLNHMTGEQSETTAMLKKAFSFMNKEMVEMVKEMKRQEKKGMRQSFPSFTALQYLYICTIDGRKQDAETIEAQNYLKKLLKKERKNQSIYEKALSAIILNAPLYVKSLKEYTVYREEMGRYYDTPRAGYSWRDYRIPTQTMAIEAIQRLTPQDTATISEMQRWLLQEKHTQAWDTPINSVDAVYAFMNGNSQALAPQPATRLAIDGKELETSKATAGIGYVKTALPAQGAKTFTAEKTSEGTSWGAVYAQFMQKTSDVKDQTESGIVVKRELLTTAGKVVNSPLKVGDRVKVRITITTDRDLDFVQVTDRRAACMEPVNQLSGYHWGYYCAPRDQSTNFYYDVLPKGKHVLETEYYIDREGEYQTGTCSVQCAYAPEFKGLTKSQTIIVKEEYEEEDTDNRSTGTADSHHRQRPAAVGQQNNHRLWQDGLRDARIGYIRDAQQGSAAPRHQRGEGRLRMPGGRTVEERDWRGRALHAQGNLRCPHAGTLREAGGHREQRHQKARIPENKRSGTGRLPRLLGLLSLRLWRTAHRPERPGVRRREEWRPSRDRDAHHEQLDIEHDAQYHARAALPVGRCHT